MKKTNHSLFNILLVIALITIGYWYAYPAFELSFKDDDAHIMRVALSYPWYAFITQPFAYQELSTAHYTPWVLWSYQLDFFLANDVNPTLFRLHQWIAISLLIGLIALLAYRLSGKKAAAIIAILLLISNPSLFQLLTENYTRHYVEGAIASSLAILTALLWIEHRKWQWEFISIIFYGFSLLCKEIYVIIPFLCLGLPAFKFRQHRRLLIAWFIVTIAFLGLRSQMLSTFGGGMQGTNIVDLLSIVQSGISNVISWLVKNHLPIILATCLALVISTQGLKTLIFLAIGLCFIVLPALFAPHVWRDPAIHADRIFIMIPLFLTLFSAVKLVNFQYVVHRYPIKKILALIGLLIWTYYTGLLNRDFTKSQVNSSNDVVIKVLLTDNSPFDALVLPPHFKSGELHWVLQYFQRKPMDLLLTEQDFLEHYLAGRKIGQFDENCHCIKLVTEKPHQCEHFLNAQNQAFKTTFSYQKNGFVQWNLSYPKTAQESGIIFLDRHLVIPVPAFSQRIARGRSGERYRFYFIGLDKNCWQSPIQTID